MLGENILKLRKKIGLSQEQLGEKVGVTRQTISNWELGETSPNPEQLKLLSKILNISIDALLDENLNEVNEIGKIKNKRDEHFKSIIKSKRKAIIIFSLLIFTIVIIITMIYNYSKNQYYKIFPEKTINNIFMDDNDIIFSIQYKDDRFYDVDNTNYNIQMSNIKIEYNDLSDIIYEKSSINYTNNKNMNSNISINLNNNILEVKFHIRKNELKRAEKINLFIENVEITTDNYKIKFDEKQKVTINIPKESLSEKVKIYKAKYANDGCVDLGSLLFVANEEFSNAQIKFIDASIRETVSGYDETTSIEDNLAIKNDSYVQDENFNKYYQINNNDSSSGYRIDKEGYLLEYWGTFQLPVNKATKNISIHLSSKNKKIIIALED